MANAGFKAALKMFLARTMIASTKWWPITKPSRATAPSTQAMAFLSLTMKEKLQRRWRTQLIHRSWPSSLERPWRSRK